MRVLAWPQEVCNCSLGDLIASNLLFLAPVEAVVLDIHMVGHMLTLAPQVH